MAFALAKEVKRLMTKFQSIDLVGNKSCGIEIDAAAISSNSFNPRIDCFFYFQLSLIDTDKDGIIEFKEFLVVSVPHYA